MRVTENVRMIVESCFTVTVTVVLSPSAFPAAPESVGVVEATNEAFAGVITVTAGATWSVRPWADAWLLGLLVLVAVNARTSYVQSRSTLSLKHTCVKVVPVPVPVDAHALNDAGVLLVAELVAQDRRATVVGGGIPAQQHAAERRRARRRGQVHGWVQVRADCGCGVGRRPGAPRVDAPRRGTCS